MIQAAQEPMRDDPREVGTYRLPEAAHYLRIPQATLRSWLLGRPYQTKTGTGFFKPLIRPADPGVPALSFINLVEAHVLDAIRREHEIPLWKVRSALDYLERHIPSPHPLADRRFMTNGVDLFIKRSSRLIVISEQGQLAMRKMIGRYLQRIVWGEDRLPIRLYPFTRKHPEGQPRAVVIDPRVQYGRPVLSRTGIPTAVIADRYKAGESVEELAEDYGRKPIEIQEAIRLELQPEAA